MKIVKPSVELIAKTVAIDPKLNTPNKLLEYMGRVCYKSENKITSDSSEKFIENIIKNGHLSVIEHYSVTMKLIIDRGISHELVRARIASYSQESTRWIRYKDGITVIEPSSLNEKTKNIWLQNCLEAEKTYLQLLDSGCKPQIARAVLPTCLKTEIITTFNLRQWLHVLKQRMPKNCHPDMRNIMFLCHDILQTINPTIFNIPELWEIRNDK